MTIRAYILINVEARADENMAEQVRLLEGIKNCENVTGAFDMVAIVEVARLDTLSELLKKLRAVEGVTATTTCIAL